MNFKEYLKRYKEKMGVSNEYIASQLGVNRSTVTRWLKGDTKVTNPEVIEKLSFILGVDVESLINSEERYEKPVLWALGVSEAETIGRRQASLTKKKNQLRMVIIYRRAMKKL